MFNMKVIFALASLVAAAVAQSVVINDPTPYTTIHPGQSVPVDIDRTPTLGASEEIAIAIGLRSCAGIATPWTCDGVDPTHDIGTVLFKGPFNPQVQAGTGRSDLIQTVTVEIPSSFPQGAALLSVVHLSLVTANPFLEVVHNTVFVE